MSSLRSDDVTQSVSLIVCSTKVKSLSKAFRSIMWWSAQYTCMQSMALRILCRLRPGARWGHAQSETMCFRRVRPYVEWDHVQSETLCRVRACAVVTVTQHYSSQLLSSIELVFNNVEPVFTNPEKITTYVFLLKETILWVIKGIKPSI